MDRSAFPANRKVQLRIMERSQPLFGRALSIEGCQGMRLPGPDRWHCAGGPRGPGRATVYQPTLGAFLLGLGAGAVGQIAVKFLLPALHLFRRCCNVSGGG